MPPKKGGPSKKAEQKGKQKAVEDKTFGLKNKNKSAKVGKYVQQVQQQVMMAGKGKNRETEDERMAKKKQKEEEERRKMELNALFKPVVTQKLQPGVDPKSVVCSFFKQGVCTKGSKCKFSHDLNVERKSAKIDLYTDVREGSNKDETMEDWDQEKLEDVIVKKHGPGIKTTTDIVCKYFLDAIEQKKYGWFWECPNGGDKCKYKHALPPGYVMKSEKKKEEEEKETITLEEFLESERHNLGSNLTPVTLESFQEWKKKRKQKEVEDEENRRKEREAQYKAGKRIASGRELFVYNPDLFKDDDEVGDVDYTTREEEEQEEQQPQKSQDVPIESSLFDDPELVDDEEEQDDEEEDNEENEKNE